MDSYNFLKMKKVYLNQHTVPLAMLREKTSDYRYWSTYEQQTGEKTLTSGVSENSLAEGMIRKPFTTLLRVKYLNCSKHYS